MIKHGLRATGWLLACLSLGACGLQGPPIDTAIAPDGAFGSNGDSDIAAINLSSWAFSSARNTRNRPVEAARAIAAVDYLAGQLSSSPRWDGMSPIVKGEMLQARAQTRAVIGVAPDARSQLVVSSLASYAASLAANGDQAAAAAYLANPAFTLGPAATEAKLMDLPFMSPVNIATQRANADAGNGTGTSSTDSN
jgi:hypothetical protein